jgi:putative ubiquitin-RnfH superfamily antitoxin RatB of RatAB toxin-antitoxin module
MIDIEIVYGLPHKQVLLSVSVPAGSSIAEAIAHSCMDKHFPDVDYSKLKVGVFGRSERPTTVIKAGDRIEIYRPLIADPKEMRRLRAEKMKEKNDN